MKKLLSILLSAIITLSTATITVDTVFADDITIYVDGTQLYTDVAPVMINDRVLVPVRAIGEALGTEVTWHEEWQEAFLDLDYLMLTIGVGDNFLLKNYNLITIDCAAQLINDRIMVPVRAISEAFNADVSYNEETSTVYIQSDFSNIKQLDWGNGAYYLGEVSDGFADGYGKVYNTYGVWKEFGLYKRGTLNGYGMSVNDDGSKYLGKFVSGVPNGYGQYYSDANEQAYLSGVFVNGLIEGECKQYDNDEHLIFKGNYVHGQRSGYGEEYDIYGNILYSGNYINGSRDNNTIPSNQDKISYYKEAPYFPDFGSMLGVNAIKYEDYSNDYYYSYMYGYNSSIVFDDQKEDLFINYITSILNMGFIKTSDDSDPIMTFSTLDDIHSIQLFYSNDQTIFYVLCSTKK